MLRAGGLVRALCLFLAALCLPAHPTLAHQQKITLSSIAHNEKTGLLEVEHRVPLHDAEHALQAQGVRAPDIINDLESRRTVARYIVSRFWVSHAGEPVEFTLLGTEIDGGRLVVYQQAPSPGPGAQLSIRSQILSDVWLRQENRVNLGVGTEVETLIFHNGDPAKAGRLPQAPQP